jgi:antitoxin MazE
MNTAIVKWGNSSAVRLPKALIQRLGLRENDKVDISVEGNAIMIRKPYPASLKELLEGGEPCAFAEWDTGKPVGDEIW